MGMQGLRETSKQNIICTRSSLVLGDLLLPLAGLLTITKPPFLTTSHPSKLSAAGPKSGREEARLGTGVDPALGSR